MKQAARALAPLTPGCIVAERYLVRRVLGQGGMGQVLEVEHVALGRAFALKVLRLEKWNEELVRRFNREARALAKITTPRVAQVTDFGVDPDVGPFYVMELLDGETLEDRLERETNVPPREALAICAELCDALSEVHAAGIVHRDLKPSNVGLTKGGVVGVKLLDFGLAAAMDDAFLSKITQSHQILGSLPYMAPEQFGTHDPTPAIDIYAVGVVLYEALAGRLPFLAPSTAALIHQILATPPPPLPSDLAALGPLEGLLERFLAKEADQRFASATAAAHALRDASLALFGAPPRAKSAHPPTRESSEAQLPTMEASAVSASSIGFLPTATMPEASGPIVESGTRLTGGVSTTIPTPPPQIAPPKSRAGLFIAIAAVVGLLLSVVVGVGVVVVLSVLEEERGDEVEAAPPPPVVPAPVTAMPQPPPQPEPVTVEVAPPAPVERPAPVIEPEREIRRPLEPRPSPRAEVAPPPSRPEPRPLPPPSIERNPPPRPPPRWNGDTVDEW